MHSWSSSDAYKTHDELSFIFKVKDIEKSEQAAIEVF